MVIRSSTKEHEGQEYTHERQLRLPCDRSMCGAASNRTGTQASRNDRYLEGLRNLTPKKTCSAFMDKRANKGVYTQGVKQRRILYAGSGATESIFFTRHDLEYRFSRTTLKTCTASTAYHTTADDDILD